MFVNFGDVLEGYVVGVDAELVRLLVAAKTFGGSNNTSSFEVEGFRWRLESKVEQLMYTMGQTEPSGCSCYIKWHQNRQ